MAAAEAVGPAPFALNPGEAVPGILNFSTREGTKYFSRATARLDPEELFDVESEGLFDFLRYQIEDATVTCQL